MHLGSEMVLEELNHSEGLELFLPEHLGHLGIRNDEQFAIRILKILLLDVGPDALDDLWPAELFVLADAHQFGEGWGEAEWFGDSFSFLDHGVNCFLSEI